MIFKFHKWYDNILEPWRFLLFLVLAIPFIGMISSEVGILNIIGAVYGAVLLLPRLYFVYKKNN